MKIRTHGKASLSRDGRRAQVTVLIVDIDGRNRRSITRHVRLVNGSWVGLNPDERAIPLNKLYKDKLRIAQDDLASAVSILAGLRRKLEEEENLTFEEKVQLYTENVGDASEKVKEMLCDDITRAELEVYAAEALVDDAESKLDQVRREHPLEVEFVGAGL